MEKRIEAIIELLTPAVETHLKKRKKQWIQAMTFVTVGTMDKLMEYELYELFEALKKRVQEKIGRV